MSPFADSLYEAFEKNKATVLKADHFLIVLRRLGATISAEEGSALIKWLGTDAGGRVDVRKFCSWFDGIEDEAHLPVTLETLHASSPISFSTSQATSALLDVELRGEGSGDEVDAEGKETHGDAREDVVEGTRRVLRLPPRQALRFDRNVYADDGAVMRLGYAHEDKCTLPSRRKLSEREKLMASLRSSLNDVKARLEVAPIEFRPDVTRNPHVAPF
eukprot:TRINITY_DN4296_c0_g2_i1.p1 TRINITY_DN4296_c0_g2~~TRINITY_DN4296_c0_g2_i1.p1  ORF type:complete len:217 (+),score=33.99 TRINITY_DN4296_c0_g2_i1:54-704(+)